MKYKWLNKQNNKKLIIFFNGWGMDEAVINHLDVENYDLVMFYDYNSLETNFVLPQIYEEKHLIAWSMGVMIATLFDFNVDTAVAINGTLCPIDEKYGIHPKIYDLTIKGFNEKGRERFIKSMFPNNSQTINISRDLNEQKTELEAIKNYTSNENFKYSKVWISDNDKIIPTKSQCAFWNCNPNVESGHCPFFSFKKWSELL